jgi:hypothetical protein
VSCTITGPGGGAGFGRTTLPLDQAAATVFIKQTSGGATASVTAYLTDRFGRTVVLGDEQEVSVNGQPLSGPHDLGQYAAAIAVADTYSITVREPTRGVQTTAITPAADFEITEPAEGGSPSLLGFTLAWTNPQDGVEVQFVLTQAFGGSTDQESFGPFVDGGSRTFTDADLRRFVQSVPLSIELTKSVVQSSVAGFSSSSVTAQVVATRSILPGS